MCYIINLKLNKIFIKKFCAGKISNDFGIYILKAHYKPLFLFKVNNILYV
jgi:hypothetical protein